MRNIFAVIVAASAATAPFAHAAAPGDSNQTSVDPEHDNTLSVLAGPRPLFQLPFPCGQQWRMDTWGHAPALDMVREPNQVGTEGALLIAPADGTVNQSFKHANAGNMIQIDHGGGWFTTYLHLQSRAVSVGQRVVRGQPIGRVGKDGPTANDHPHLHFELAIDANGDGKATWGAENTERVRPWFNGIEYGQSNGRTWRNTTSFNCPSSSLSGDSRAELVAQDASGQLIAYPNIDGLNFNWGTSRVVGTGWTDPARTHFADLDGDGRTELIAQDTAGNLRAYPNIDGMNFNWGASRVVGTGWTDPARIHFADLNGDRRAELILQDTAGNLIAYPNIDGLNFNWGPPRVIGTGWTDPARTRFADLNGDGRAELMLQDTGGNLIAYPNVDALNFNWGTPRVIGTGWTDPARTHFADLDGDGRAELISQDTAGNLIAYPNIDGLNFNWGASRVIGTGWTDPARTHFV